MRKQWLVLAALVAAGMVWAAGNANAVPVGAAPPTEASFLKPSVETTFSYLQDADGNYLQDQDHMKVLENGEYIVSIKNTSKVYTVYGELIVDANWKYDTDAHLVWIDKYQQPKSCNPDGWCYTPPRPRGWEGWISPGKTVVLHITYLPELYGMDGSWNRVNEICPVFTLHDGGSTAYFSKCPKPIPAPRA